MLGHSVECSGTRTLQGTDFDQHPAVLLTAPKKPGEGVLSPTATRDETETAVYSFSGALSFDYYGESTVQNFGMFVGVVSW